MCGIYGVIETDGPRTVIASTLARMGSVIEHRGPDDFGHYDGGAVGLGMRRLSVIDLAGGHQPMTNEDESIWLVMNGEIYNYRELRNLLEKRGHRFRTNSDTEVVVHLYEDEGVDVFGNLRGMFGLAIWDTKRERLILARDRVGEKPLYFCRGPQRLLFASELKSILQVEDLPRRLDLEALQEYLALGYVPAPLSLLQGIQKLVPGHYLVYEKGQVATYQYWDVPCDHVEEHSEEQWAERVRAKLLETVESQLISDVPLGAFLSGGIDSSTIVAAMTHLTGRAVKTYSIGYGGDQSYYNELPYAKLIANKFGTDHHEIVVRPEVSDLLPKLIWHLDEPIADSACLTTFLVSRLARESVTVILSGVGGDELFGGYRRYLGDSFHRWYRVLPFAVRRSLIPALLRKIPQDRTSAGKDYARYAAAFSKTAEMDPVNRYMSYVTLLSPQAQASLLAPALQKDADAVNAAAAALRRYFQNRRERDALNQTLYVDLKTSLPDDLLALTDRMSMAASIECRAPLVDYQLIELASRMPSRLKVRGFSLKYLLKKAVAPWLPREILFRKKRGFGAPLGGWLRHELRPLVRDLLSEQQIRKRGLFQWSAVNQLIRAHEEQVSDHTDHIFALIALELWCQVYLDGAFPLPSSASAERAKLEQTSNPLR